MTMREQPCFFLNLAMSALICNAISYLFLPFLTFLPSSIFTYSRSNAAGIGLILERNVFTIARWCGSSTPAFAAASYELSGKISQPPKTMSSNLANFTKSLMRGERPSVRLPRRMVAICVSEPTGCAFFVRTSSTPAMKVVGTAPIPGNKTPSFPLGAAILVGFSMNFLSYFVGGQRKAQPSGRKAVTQTINDGGSPADMQMGSGEMKGV